MSGQTSIPKFNILKLQGVMGDFLVSTFEVIGLLISFLALNIKLVISML